MGIAETVGAAIGKVAFPSVMDGRPLKKGKYAHRLHRFATPFGVHLITGQFFTRCYVQPIQLSTDPHTGFVEMCNRFTSKGLFDPLSYLFYPFSTPSVNRCERTYADRCAEEIFKQFCC